MNSDRLEINCAMQIQKPIHEVFDAIINPKKMSNYFIATSTGIMEEGKNLIWKFPEFDFECPVKVGKVENNKFVSFYWGEDIKNALSEVLDKKKSGIFSWKMVLEIW